MLLLNIILGAVIAIYALAGIAALFPPKPFLPLETTKAKAKAKVKRD